MNPNKLLQNIRLGLSPIVIVAATTLAAISISIYCLYSGWVIIFQNLFYVPIIIACVLYTKKGFAFSVVLSFLYLFLIIFFTRDSAVILQALIRICIFVGVAAVTTFLSIARKRTEDAMRESEEKYRLLFDSAGDAIYIHTENARLLAINSLAYERLGYTHAELMLMTINQVDSPEEASHAPDRIAKLMEQGSHSFETVHQRKDGSLIPTEVSARRITWDGQPAMMIICRDITERRRAGAYREIAREVLQTLNEPADLQDSIQRVIAVFKTWTECDAVAIRLQDGDDFPYFAQKGFSDEFLLTENTIIGRAADGGVCRDKDGNVSLECICGLVISGKTDPANPLFTAGGSFWTNDSLRLLDIPPSEDPRLHPRNQCIHQGYASVVHVPIWNKDRVVGLIQFNDRRKGRFTLEAVELLEGIASHIGAALMRKRAEEALNEAHKGLERKVYERTSELERINEILAAEIEDRMKSEAALLESEEKYRNIFNNAIEGIYQTTPEGRFLSLNPALAQKHGYASPEEMTASITDIGQQLYVNPQDRDKWMELLDAHEFVNNFETQHYKKDGTKIWVSFSARVVKDKEGKILYYEGGMEDITERKRAGEENLHLEKQLRQAQKMEAIGTLAGGIAHDFNNILGAISGYTELALTRVPADSKEEGYLKRIFTATRRAVDLVSQILAFSRQSEKELRTLRLSPIIKEVLKLIRATTPTTIDIRQNITAEPDLVIADATYIHQVFMNLCMNANHAMQKKGGVLSVGLINERIVSDDMNHPGVNPGPYLKLTVSDTGEGIEPAVIEKIFDPFFTTKKQGEGTGLGLAVVYGIVQSLGGEIKVDSRLGQGTSFEVWLPMLADSLLENFSEGWEDTINIRGSGRILFVDDEEALVEMATDMLENLGYEVTATQSSVEALEIFRANPDRFDLVITDQTMPQMTGMVLAKEIMMIRSDTPIILCTGFSSTVNAGEVKNAGIRDFVFKPLIKNKIADSIHRILKKPIYEHSFLPSSSER
jgi:PAS domain S-box-containing protein